MRDIQNLRDHRRINIRKVGVKTISYPITVLDRKRQTQQTIATVNMYVDLPHRFKGTHMSRFIEILNRFHGCFNVKNFYSILKEMQRRLEAETAHLEIEFPYFVPSAESDRMIGAERYLCRMHGVLQRERDLILEVEVPITRVRKPHEQGGLPRFMGRWGYGRVAVRFRNFIWLEELIALVREGLQSDMSLPESVESVCKRLAERLRRHPEIRAFKAEVENFADGYSTFAVIQEPQDGHRYCIPLQEQQSIWNIADRCCVGMI